MSTQYNANSYLRMILRWGMFCISVAVGSVHANVMGASALANQLSPSDASTDTVYSAQLNQEYTHLTEGIHQLRKQIEYVESTIETASQTTTTPKTNADKEEPTLNHSTNVELELAAIRKDLHTYIETELELRDQAKHIHSIVNHAGNRLTRLETDKKALEAEPPSLLEHTNIENTMLSQIYTSKLSINALQNKLILLYLDNHDIMLDFIHTQLSRLHNKIERTKRNRLLLETYQIKKLLQITEQYSEQKTPTSLHHYVQANNKIAQKISSAHQDLIATREKQSKLHEIKIAFQKLVDDISEIDHENQTNTSSLQQLKQRDVELLNMTQRYDINPIKTNELIEQNQKSINFTNHQIDRIKQSFGLSDNQNTCNNLIDNHGAPLNSFEICQKLIAIRSSLLQQFNKVQRKALSQLIKIRVIEQDIRNHQSIISKRLNNALFITRETNIISTSWKRNIVKATEELIQAQLMFKKSISQSHGYPHKSMFCMVLSIIILLVKFIRPIKLRIESIKSKVGNVSKDRFIFTLESIIYTLLYALPIPLFIWAYSLVLSNNSLTEPYGSSFLKLGCYSLIILFLHQTRKVASLGKVHFNWSNEKISAISKLLLPLVIGTLLQFSIQLTAATNSDVVIHTYTRILIFLQMTLVMIATSQFMVLNRAQPTHHTKVGWVLRYAIRSVTLLSPLGIMAITWHGQLHIAIKACEHVMDTIVAIILIHLLYHVLIRWLLIEQRRLAFDRALAKRATQHALKANHPTLESIGQVPYEVREMKQIDMATVSAHNRGLVSMFSVALFLVIAWITWRDLTPAISILDTIEFWGYSYISDGKTTQGYVTLYDCLVALIAISVTAYAGTNMPGFIETVVLKRLPIETGVRFAITRISRYTIIIFGIYLALRLLHLSTASLGWLIAAIGVGLGFGLQEIFANFVSGLIILFERPIRMGDLVSIENITGTVTNIQMRATTLTDYDRVETIIPNKSIVTNRLMNWTLSDGITRLRIKVGVAYGSDANLTAKKLLEAAKSVPTVLAEPAPQAIFIEFGNSALVFELLAFVDDYLMRIPTQDALHHAIYRILTQANVVIAFPQLDVHIHEEAKLSK